MCNDNVVCVFFIRAAIKTSSVVETSRRRDADDSGAIESFRTKHWSKAERFSDVLS